mmetsp:Transcript_32148/g.62832  ORF Transcript_32148/g.62832 Transcript_32148/m.62832 type:complete len:87 (+) Transcript_32148:320-580(+)
MCILHNVAERVKAVGSGAIAVEQKHMVARILGWYHLVIDRIDMANKKEVSLKTTYKTTETIRHESSLALTMTSMRRHLVKGVTDWC